jgi:shikimate kinase
MVTTTLEPGGDGSLDDRSNIVLTGFMGTGKSTVGRLFAKRTGRTFVDTDTLIEQRHGPIHQIFEQAGEEAFRQMERDVASELGSGSDLVIATGGRMMLEPSNIAALGGGRIFTLVADVDEIYRRIVSSSGPRRPLLEVDDPLGRIRALLAERRPGYELFTRIQSGGRTPSAVADEISELVERGAITLERGDAVITLGAGELSRWRRATRSEGPFVTVFGSSSARRYEPVVGNHETNRSGTTIAVGGLPPGEFGLYIPTELPTLLWWVSHPEARGAALFDVGLFLDDLAGLAMLDEYVHEFTDGEARPWCRRSGSHPGLLAWMLEAIGAVCHRHGFRG